MCRWCGCHGVGLCMVRCVGMGIVEYFGRWSWSRFKSWVEWNRWTDRLGIGASGHVSSAPAADDANCLF